MKITVPSLSIKQSVIVFLTFVVVFAGNSLLSGCAQAVKDPKRDAMVSAYTKLRPIIQRVLRVDRERVLPVASWSDLGLADPDSDKGLQLRKEISKEFKKEIPENLFNPDSEVGAIIKYIAVECYGADFNQTLEYETDSTLMAPHFRKQIKKDLGVLKDESAEEELYPGDAIQVGENEEAKEEKKAEAEKQKDAADKTDEKKAPADKQEATAAEEKSASGKTEEPAAHDHSENQHSHSH